MMGSVSVEKQLGNIQAGISFISLKIRIDLSTEVPTSVRYKINSTFLINTNARKPFHRHQAVRLVLR